MLTTLNGIVPIFYNMVPHGKSFLLRYTGISHFSTSTVVFCEQHCIKRMSCTEIKEAVIHMRQIALNGTVDWHHVPERNVPILKV